MPLCADAQNTIIRSSNSTGATSRTTSGGVPLGDESSDTVTSQEPQGIIFDTGEEADSVMRVKVFGFSPLWRDVKLREVEHPSLDPTDVARHNVVHRFDGDYYLDRGALGQSHLSLYPFGLSSRTALLSREALPPLALTFIPDANPVYHRLHHVSLFQTQTPYTLLHYGSSLNKDYQIGIIHTQNIKPRWNIAFRYDLTSREGVYTNAGGTNHLLDFSTNYYSEDARYQVQANLTFNRMRQEENGGVQNDTTCWDDSRRAGVPVNMYAAQNMWRDLQLTVHQSYNTVRQFNRPVPIVETRIDTLRETRQVSDTLTGDSIVLRNDTVVSLVPRDTIVGYDTLYAHTPHTYNTGVFAMDLRVGRQRRIFSDSQPDSWFYDNLALDTTFYFDSTALHQVVADLYWTNDAYMSHRWHNPFILKGGIRPEYSRLQFADAQYSYFALSPFAHAEIALRHFLLSVDAEEVTGGYRNGDYRIASSLRLDIAGRHDINLLFLSEAQQPALIYYHNEGCYSWDYDRWDKVHRQQLAFNYRYATPDTVGGLLRQLNLTGSSMLIGNNIWLDETMTPTQGNATGLLFQATLSTQLRHRWLNLRLQEMVQYSSDDAVIRVPLLASKNSLYADFTLFRNAMRMQTGFDLRAHTRYYADGWNPILGSYYRQDAVQVGGYIVLDYWLTLQIKRASIYLRVNHLNAPLEKSPRYFSLPHYPMEDLGVYWGIIWKFFN